ncbi:MAG: response regulator [Chloroflexi bacterium]|jgi:PAS domain S-box-containing protein|nr:response regulator [Chloroflexota bacterium]
MDNSPARNTQLKLAVSLVWHALAHLQDALYVVDLRTGEPAYLNRAIEEITGFNTEELRELGTDGLRERVHPDDREQYLLADRETPSLEYRWLHKDGSYRWLSDSRTLVRGEQGQPYIMAGILRDVTEQKQAEQALRTLNAALEQQVTEQAEQLRNIAGKLNQAHERERQRMARLIHDHLQQLLVAARLHVNTIARRLEEAPLHRAAQRVDEVLAEAIATSRSLTAELSPPVLHDAGLIPALHWLARWVQEKLGLTVEVDAQDLRSQTPELTRATLFQATRELLLNVAQHAKVQHAVITVKQLYGDEIELVVADQGVGFDPDALFESDDHSGLFAIQERLQLLGGRMQIESAPGQGTRITLWAPLRPGEVIVPKLARLLAESNQPDESLGAGKQETAGRPPVRVLLVDDHAIVREGLAQLLIEEPGIELVGQASDGHEAVELARSMRPNVVLMDVSMPGMDGVEATRLILAELPDVQVIGLSMYEGTEMEARMRKAGAVDYMSKVDDQVALIRAVRKRAEK